MRGQKIAWCAGPRCGAAASVEIVFPWEEKAAGLIIGMQGKQLETRNYEWKSLLLLFWEPISIHF